MTIHKKHLSGFVALLLATTFMTSCSDETIIPDSNDDTTGELVKVNLNLMVADESATRAVDDPNGKGDNDTHDPTKDGEGTKIHNIWVLQFNGAEDDSNIITWSNYIEANSGKSLTEQKQIVELVASQEESLIIVLANTFDPNFNSKLTKNMTLRELKDLPMLVHNQASVLSVSTAKDNTKTFPDDASYHLMFNSMKKQVVTNGCTIDCMLKRNLARIDITMNVLNTSGLTIKDIKLCNVPAKEYYLTDYDLGDKFPQSKTFQTVEFEYDVFNAEPDATTDDTKITYKLRYYTTPNIRGNGHFNSTDRYKNWQAPADATYLYVEATYLEEGVETPINYTFYLGEDMLSDFNIKPNHKYAYTFDFKNKGNYTKDSRITDRGIKDFTKVSELSNCYICTPPTIANYARRFRIPIKRVNEFWDKEENSYSIKKTDHWEAFIIWADFPFNDTNQDGIQMLNLTTSEGYGVETADNKPTYFEVEIPRGVAGNALIGVRRIESSSAVTPTLWSWHLWITDYAPDQCDLATIDHNNEQYIYKVNGGAVHRYAGTEWEEGGWAENVFIMDRFIGMVSDRYNDKYQYMYSFGSKDPKPYNAVYTPGYNNKTANSNLTMVTTAKAKQDAGSTIRHSVFFPFKHIYCGGNWNTDDDYNYYQGVSTNGFSRWNDPTIAASDPDCKKKSIFDPSPLGWLIPCANLWSDWGMMNSTNPTTNIKTSGDYKRNFPAPSTISGYCYWPSKGGDWSADNLINYTYITYITILS